MPLIRIVFISLQEGYDFFSESYTSIGIGNYLKVISDPMFTAAVSHTLIYAICSGIPALVISLFLANCLIENTFVNRLFQTSFFMPLVTSTVAICLVWKFMFNESFGIINYVVTAFGGERIGWFSDKHLQLLMLILLGIWELIPITLLLLLSAFQGIDTRLLHSASMDTPSGLKVFWKIKLPLIKSTVITVAILNFIDSIKVFDVLFPLFNGRAGTTNNLPTLVYYVYYYMFERSNYGIAAASAVIIIAAIAAVMVLFSLVKKWLGKGNENKQ